MEKKTKLAIKAALILGLGAPVSFSMGKCAAEANERLHNETMLFMEFEDYYKNILGGDMRPENSEEMKREWGRYRDNRKLQLQNPNDRRDIDRALEDYVYEERAESLNPTNPSRASAEITPPPLQMTR
jgi:hypothetical protein